MGSKASRRREAQVMGWGMPRENWSSYAARCCYNLHSSYGLNLSDTEKEKRLKWMRRALRFEELFQFWVTGKGIGFTNSKTKICRLFKYLL